MACGGRAADAGAVVGARKPADRARASYDWLLAQPSRDFHVVDGVPLDEPIPPIATTRRGANARGDVHAAVPDARLDRPFGRGGSVEDGSLTVWTAMQGPFPLRICARGGALDPGGAGARRPRRRTGLLRPQRRRRRVARRGAPRPGRSRTAGAAQVVARGRARLGAIRPGDGGEDACRASTRTAISSTGTTTCGGRRTTRARFHTESARCSSPAWYLDPPVPRQPAKPFLLPQAGMHRNADPLYRVPLRRIVKHFVETMPLAIVGAARARRVRERVRDRVVHGRAGRGSRPRPARVPPRVPR